MSWLQHPWVTPTSWRFFLPLRPCGLSWCASGQAPGPWVPCLPVDPWDQAGLSPPGPLSFPVLLGVLMKTDWGSDKESYTLISSAATFNFSNLTVSISTLPGTPGAPGEPGKPGRQGLSGPFPALPRDGLSLLLARSGTCEHEDETRGTI